MYMMYETKQFSDYKKQKRYITINSYKQNEGLHRYPQPPQRFPTALPKPPFMPSKLIRTSDMKLVPGSTVNEGYCALSYTWNQLGDHTTINKNIGKTIEHKDLGKHKIIFPAYTVRQKPRGRKRIRRKVRFVTFEGLIQRICKDFNIKYIWYDQTCINQRDRKEKQGQLHGRHLIYSNAYCTLALIPEFQVKSENVIVRKNNSNLQTINSKSTERISKYRRYFISNKHIFDSQWMKNTWTMQEVLSSKRLLLIGQNVHSWRYQPKDIIIINDKPDHLTMGAILYHAHSRTSISEHDHVFALANIIPEILEKITIDYDQPIMELMIQFYGLLAKKDLTMLCFGSHTQDGYKTICQNLIHSTSSNGSDHFQEYQVPIQKFKWLPSWTGVEGEHLQFNMKTDFRNYNIDGKNMHITCTAIKNNSYDQRPLLTSDDIPPKPQVRDGHGRRINWILVISVRLSSEPNEDKIVRVLGPVPSNLTDNDLVPHVIQRLEILSRFIPIKKENLHWWNRRLVPNQNYCTTFRLDYLTEELHKTSQYAILSGVPFEIHNRPNLHAKYYPVIKKKQEGNHYEAIGICQIDHPEYFFSDHNLQEQTFVIQ